MILSALIYVRLPCAATLSDPHPPPSAARATDARRSIGTKATAKTSTMRDLMVVDDARRRRRCGHQGDLLRCGEDNYGWGGRDSRLGGHVAVPPPPRTGDGPQGRGGRDISLPMIDWETGAKGREWAGNTREGVAWREKRPDRERHTLSIHRGQNFTDDELINLECHIQSRLETIFS
jgi:hypothetical protein